MSGWQWHQLDHMQIICTSLQTDDHANMSIFTGRMPFLMPDQQCQITEGRTAELIKLEMWANANVIASLHNIGGALCSTPQSLADAY